VRIDVAPTADAVVPAELAGVTALVIDVLRASTTIITALTNGCDAIVPVADPAEARRRALATRNGGALVAGERQGEPIPGFDLSNSPVEFQSPRVRGKTVYFTTSNGTRALLVARAADAIGVMALVNVTAAAAWAVDAGRDVAILCAGSHGRHSLEDWTCGGLAVDRILAAVPTAVLTDAARDALETGRRYAAEVGRLKHDAPWARRLIAAGRAADVDACLRLDTTSLVPRYLPNVDKIVGDRR
jgi:2-phosphosulfolactate phosphatase